MNDKCVIHRTEYGVVCLIHPSIEGFEYEIPSNDLTDVQYLCNWIRHICEKSWVTTDHIKGLAEIAHMLHFEMRHQI